MLKAIKVTLGVMACMAMIAPAFAVTVEINGDNHWQDQNWREQHHDDWNNWRSQHNDQWHEWKNKNPDDWNNWCNRHPDDCR